MFDFLKKKLKESVNSLKNIFKTSLSSEESLEGKKPAKEIEPISEPEKEAMQEVKEEVNEEIKEEKKEEAVKEEEQKHVAEEVKELQKEVEKTEKVIEKAVEEEDFVAAKKLKELAAKAKEALKGLGAETKKEEAVEEKKEEPTPEKPKEEKKGFFGKLFGKHGKKEVSLSSEDQAIASQGVATESLRSLKGKKIEEAKPAEKKPEEKKGLFAGLFEKTLNEEEFEKFFANLEISLLESNLAYEVTQLLKKRLKAELVGKKIPRGKGEEILFKTIEDTFRGILFEKHPDEILKVINENKAKGVPTKFLFLGVNGVGKTTTLAKMCQWLKDKGYSAVISASDTFRAASIEQLEKHASRLGVDVIKHKYGGDPAAVAFDAIEHAKSKKIDVVLIDSAGRQHTSANLMDELKKLKRVAKPDFSIFVADAMTGNDAVEQAREFGEQIGFDFSILGKTDVDQKGGAILSVSYVSGKPIAFLGTGQEYKDIEPFDREKLLKRIF
ncbi:MAG: signal recognition particle-docking protein FtsY [Candidatus Nanoarchaeia archaeon]|nr:signal recognition particle-docking protein FtsY [Candidatus Nanoarchaeia archaeon]MDD5239597.1 signal recognition particle-docking protein FtsY [Candidatus Nanoarchaeia archaeon]